MRASRALDSHGYLIDLGTGHISWQRERTKLIWKLEVVQKTDDTCLFCALATIHKRTNIVSHTQARTHKPAMHTHTRTDANKQTNKQTNRRTYMSTNTHIQKRQRTVVNHVVY